MCMIYVFEIQDIKLQQTPLKQILDINLFKQNIGFCGVLNIQGVFEIGTFIQRGERGHANKQF